MTIGARSVGTGPLRPASTAASTAPITRKCSAGSRAAALTARRAPCPNACIVEARLLALRPQLPARRFPEAAVGLVVCPARESEGDPVIGRRGLREVEPDRFEREGRGAALVDADPRLLDAIDRACRVVV